MTEHPVTRKANLLSKGQLLTQRWSASPGRPGTPEIYHNGLGRYFVGKPVLDQENRVTIEYAPDPHGVLEQAASNIRRSRFGSPTYDQDQHFPVTRRLAYAAFPDTRPKNQATAATDEWIVPEAERGECSATQAAALGLPYRHRVTGETIAEWTQRTLHDHVDGTSQAGNMEEQQEQEVIHLLRNLPISITISKRNDTYIWQVLEESGTSEDFVGVVGYGLHAVLGHLMQEQEGRQEHHRAFGDILYQTEDGYTERVIADTSKARVVMCELQGSIKLFRIEWAEKDGYEQNRAAYTLQDAMDAFQAAG